MKFKSNIPSTPDSSLHFAHELNARLAEEAALAARLAEEAELASAEEAELAARLAKEEAEHQHRDRTPLCPSLRDLAMLDMSKDQQEHAESCRYCKRMLRVAQERLLGK
jgi:hypothetical protein